MAVPPVLFPFGYPHTLYHSLVGFSCFCVIPLASILYLVKVNVYTSVICFQIYLKKGYIGREVHSVLLRIDKMTGRDSG